MKKEQGFTLVELLAVITILGLLALLASSAVSGIIRGARNDTESINIDTILNAAYDYVQRNPAFLPEPEEKPTKICATALINDGLLKCEMVEDRQMDEKYDIENHMIVISYESEIPSENKEDVKTEKYFGRYKFSYDELDIDCSEHALQCNVANQND